MTAAAFVPAATLLRIEPGTRLAATPTGSVVHVLNRPGGIPVCHRDRQTVTELPADQPAPALRVCEPCLTAIPAGIRLDLREAATDAERTAVREHAHRQGAAPLFLAVPPTPDHTTRDHDPDEEDA